MRTDRPFINSEVKIAEMINFLGDNTIFEMPLEEQCAFAIHPPLLLSVCSRVSFALLIR
jgi:hypothetical protein